MKKVSKRTTVLLVVALAAVVAAVGAYAYWTTTGSGSGSASTGTDVGVTVNQNAVAANSLYPGGSVALSGTFTNGASFNQYVTSVSATIPAFSSQTDPLKPACTEADFFITGSPTAVGQQIAANSTGGTWSGISLNMTNTTANQDNCKNLTVNLAYTST